MEEDSTPGTPFHFGIGLYLYPHTTHFTAPFDRVYFQVHVDSLGQILGQLTMFKQPSTSQTVSSDEAAAESFVATSSLFSTTPKSHLYGESSIPIGTNLHLEPIQGSLLHHGLHPSPQPKFYLVLL